MKTKEEIKERIARLDDRIINLKSRNFFISKENKLAILAIDYVMENLMWVLGEKELDE